ncbi:hypothetical protein JCM9534A_65590 [Catenuloplanes indicus JCM 9534]|uniref:SAM-dependent methyltransferase n=1 Tax=Catenuloplanes indicus TaxID=137267 RepID=A0AAE4B452_9ACTN|nr:SAM-dependent methyltransferase [Catenuloplanes indicus]
MDAGAEESLAGVVCWFSLLFLAPESRPRAFAELARVVRPGGYLVAAFEHGDGSGHRNLPGSRVARLGVDFDRYWLPAAERRDRCAAAGFAEVFEGGVPAEDVEPWHGYLLVRRER